jgi:hypothetical protein
VKETTSRNNARVMLDLGTLAAVILTAAVQDAPRRICCIHQKNFLVHIWGVRVGHHRGRVHLIFSFGPCVVLASVDFTAFTRHSGAAPIHFEREQTDVQTRPFLPYLPQHVQVSVCLCAVGRVRCGCGCGCGCEWVGYTG